MSTNGSQAAPSRERIIMTAAYYAAIEGYYDTSEAAQKSNLLSISVVDIPSVTGDPLPPGATHRFYVMINASGFMVTRYPDESYKVEPHDRMQTQRQERELRDAVLDAALWHLTGEGAGYHVGAGQEARAAAIETARIAFAPRRLLFDVPSMAIMVASSRRWLVASMPVSSGARMLSTFSTACSTPLPR